MMSRKRSDVDLYYFIGGVMPRFKRYPELLLSLRQTAKVLKQQRLKKQQAAGRR